MTSINNALNTNGYENTNSGWERVNNPEAIRYYKQRQMGESDVKNPDESWYRKWVGPFAMLDTENFTKAMIKSSNITVSDIIYDASGYIIVPQSALQ